MAGTTWDGGATTWDSNTNVWDGASPTVDLINGGIPFQPVKRPNVATDRERRGISGGRNRPQKRSKKQQRCNGR